MNEQVVIEVMGIQTSGPRIRHSAVSERWGDNQVESEAYFPSCTHLENVMYSKAIENWPIRTVH